MVIIADFLRLEYYKKNGIELLLSYYLKFSQRIRSRIIYGICFGDVIIYFLFITDGHEFRDILLFPPAREIAAHRIE